MQRKPIILILNSRDENGNVAERVAAEVKKIGSHNVVVIDDDKYGSEPKTPIAEKLSVSGKFAKKRAVRIANSVKRYRPAFILAVTPYAYASAVDAKKKQAFATEIIYLMPYFVVDKTYEDTGVFIVENTDMKAQLVAQGIPSKKVMTMGLPFDVEKKTPLEIAAAKQELGLPRTTSILLNAEPKDGAEELFSLLLDQGDVINIVVYCEDAKTVPLLRAKADAARATNAIILQNADQYDEYLSACDAVITRFDRQTIYKCFKLNKPVITFGGGEPASKELNYLVEKGLVLRANENIEIVGLIYRLMQTGVAASYVQAADKWVELSSLGNIASYLVTYIGM